MMREKNIVLLLEVVFILVVCLVITSFKAGPADFSELDMIEESQVQTELVIKE